MLNRISIAVMVSVLAAMIACTQFTPVVDTPADVVPVDEGGIDTGSADIIADTAPTDSTIDADVARDIVEPDIRDTEEPFPDIPPIECASNLACERAFDDLPTCWRAFCDEWLNICIVAPALDGAGCDPEDKCVRNAVCLGGACVGAALSCDDGNVCTTDTCNPALGCSHVNNSDGCSDGNPCTDGDKCINGTCRAGTNSCACTDDPDCAQYNDDDLCNGMIRCIGEKCVIDQTTIRKCTAIDDPCLANLCDPASGTCRETPIHEGEICDDEDDCTVNDVCRSGICAGSAAQCDDGNECTADLCDLEGGCVHPFNTDSCDDGNACTENDTCRDGLCIGTRIIECGCIVDADCAAVEDGNPCNGTLVCRDYSCVIDPATVVRCSDPFGKPCQRSACNPATGRCAVVQLDDNRPCVDANSCTFDEYCDAGECVGTEVPCVDENLCTDDYCDEFGGCFHAYNTEPCEDGNPCTVDDRCFNGNCAAGPDRECDDFKPCTLDMCSPLTGCYAIPITEPGVECDTGDPCILNSTCQNGLCVGERRNCEDGDPCTDNYCDSNDGLCKKRNNSSPCEDGNDCTVNDYCSSGFCRSGPARDCSDTDPCTADRCVVGSGCVRDPITGCQHCPGGQDSECVSPYFCKVGVCDMSSDPLGRCQWVADTCDDGNPCTAGTCNQFTGLCSYSPVTGSCDDGNPCTLNDQCNTAQMKCVGTLKPCDDGNICTDDYCDTADGQCRKTDNMAPCDDGDPCTVEDTCSGGTCSVSTDKICEDGDPCTDNYCDPITGQCRQTINGADCEDGDPCTVGDYCDLGECLTGSPKNCSDDNECTADSCRESDGVCLHDPIVGIPCGAANKCIISGTCNSLGGCDATYVVCNDNNICTTDVCAPSTGICAYNPNTLPCNDNDACTSDDTCFSRLCIGNEITCDDEIACTVDSCDTEDGCVFTPQHSICDDGNECTTDVCDPLFGCVNTPVDDAGSYACSDDNGCTLNDVCVGGECVGTPKNCKDALACTNDSCNTATGACINAYFTGPCDDGNPCTSGETCNVSGVCGNSTAVVCNDGIACTTDFCQAGVGCIFQPVNSVCNDSKACTVDTCVVGTGCTNTPVTTPISCDDGNLCTTSDTCNTTTGQCVGTMKNCDDGNVCTTDQCNTSTGICGGSPASGPCNDGLSCTAGDYCVSGICFGFSTIDCLDAACAADPRCQ